MKYKLNNINMIINNINYKISSHWHEMYEEPLKNSFLKTLKIEVSKKHILYNRKITPIAYKDNQDEFLVYIHDLDKITVVHLTYSGKTESNPMCPNTDIFDSINDFLNDEYFNNIDDDEKNI